jgi:hypothetical protein
VISQYVVDGILIAGVLVAATGALGLSYGLIGKIGRQVLRWLLVGIVLGVTVTLVYSEITQDWVKGAILGAVVGFVGALLSASDLDTSQF